MLEVWKVKSVLMGIVLWILSGAQGGLQVRGQIVLGYSQQWYFSRKTLVYMYDFLEGMLCS